MERDQATVARLNEWADWVHSGLRSGKPSQMRSWWGPMVTDPNMGSSDGYGRRYKQEVNYTRADQVDAAVRQIDDLSRSAIFQHYIIGGTKEQKAAALGFKKSYFYELLADAEAKVQIILGSGK